MEFAVGNIITSSMPLHAPTTIFTLEEVTRHFFFNVVQKYAPEGNIHPETYLELPSHIKLKTPRKLNSHITIISLPLHDINKYLVRPKYTLNTQTL